MDNPAGEAKNNVAQLENIELLKLDDSQAMEFCANYISSAWHEELPAARSRLLKYAQGAQLEFCVVAKIADVPVGMMAFYPRTGLECDGVYEPWSAGLYVVESHRKQGIGERLLARLQQEARSRGFQKVHLATNLDQLKKWYQSLGWQKVGQAWWDGQHYDVFVFDLK